MRAPYRVLAIDTKKYRRRQRKSMICEVVSQRPLALIEGGPGPRLTACLRSLIAADPDAPVIGFVTDGASALATCITNASKGLPYRPLHAANAFHLVEDALALVCDCARSERRRLGLSPNLSRFETLLRRPPERLSDDQHPAVRSMLDASPRLAALYDYIHRFVRILDRGDLPALWHWVATPPPGVAILTAGFRSSLRQRRNQIGALVRLRAITGLRVSTGQVESLQREVSKALDALGGRGKIAPAWGAVMARRGWTPTQLRTAAAVLWQTEGGQ